MSDDFGRGAGKLAAYVRELYRLHTGAGTDPMDRDSRDEYADDQHFLRKLRNSKEKRQDNWMKVAYTVIGGIILFGLTTGMPLLGGWLRVLARIGAP